MSTIITPIQALNMMSKTNQYYIMEYYFEGDHDMYYRCFDSVESIIRHIMTNRIKMYGELTPLCDDEVSIFHIETARSFNAPTAATIKSETGIRLSYNDYNYILPTIDGVSKQVIDHFKAL